MQHIVDHALLILTVDSPYGVMQMHLGFGPDAATYEVGTIDDAEDGETVIHAMPMRRRYRDLLGRVRGSSR